MVSAVKLGNVEFSSNPRYSLSANELKPELFVDEPEKNFTIPPEPLLIFAEFMILISPPVLSVTDCDLPAFKVIALEDVLVVEISSETVKSPVRVSRLIWPVLVIPVGFTVPTEKPSTST